MLDLLAGFVAELRANGIPVSLTEHLDAAEALGHVPLEDRQALKYSLGASLVKSSAHWRAYETAFEIYFSTRGPGSGTVGLSADGGGAEVPSTVSGGGGDGRGPGTGSGSGEGMTPTELADRLY